MSQASTIKIERPAPRFNDGLSHISAELKWLDMLIARRIAQFRNQTGELATKVAATPGYISDEEVDWLLQRPHNFSQMNHAHIDNAINLHKETVVASVAASEQAGSDLPLMRLCKLFNLSWFEANVILLCLAPELRRKYDRIYAYLQDDVTRKRPSLDLALELFVDDESERWLLRGQLGDENQLFAYQLVQASEDLTSPSGSSGLSRLLKLEPRILQYILGNNQCDQRIAPLIKYMMAEQSELCVDKEQLHNLHQLIHATLYAQTAHELPLLHFHGLQESAKRELALALCQKLNCGLLVLDARSLLSSGERFETTLLLILRESILLQTPLLIENIEEWLVDESVTRGRLHVLVSFFKRFGHLIMTAAKQVWPVAFTSSLTVVNVAVALTNNTQQEHLWRHALQSICFKASGQEVQALTQQFRLSVAQIKTVTKQLRLQAIALDRALPLSYLAMACRDVSSHGLSSLSANVKAHYQWQDLVLPESLKQQLRDICAQVRFARQVFDEWGFSEKFAYGRGLSVMFFGVSGTGKTMAAQVIAKELQHELFKIDLSGVVSKYIGETEKNLNRIFNEAQSSNAILFFDEADALFGKRTDVSDAHDRYANIEVSYLLQKMEEYEGTVILATNLRNNIDDAFLRRIRFLLEFPFPDAANRCEIWQKCIPSSAPVDDEIDFTWLAEHIKVAGGNIKNIVLNAAFLAAQQGEVLAMQHLLSGCQQEFHKIGKLWDVDALQYKQQKVN
ncbi:MAG: ATP-binding protein [Methylobacter sp.]|jgi:hypothetical protein